MKGMYISISFRVKHFIYLTDSSVVTRQEMHVRRGETTRTFSRS